jgi:hypothetical protein
VGGAGDEQRRGLLGVGAAQLAVAQSDVTARLRVDVVGIGGTNSLNFLKLRTGSGTAIAEVFLTPGRLLGWRNDVTSVSTTSQTVVPVGAWAEVAFHVVVNGTSSTVQVLLDGVPCRG